MISDDKRMRLVAKLLALTQQKRILWQRLPHTSCFSATIEGLRFHLKHVPAHEYGRRAGGYLVAVEVWDGDQDCVSPIDTFTDRDRVPILEDLYEIVEHNDSNFGAVSAKIEAFLARDVTHAQ